MNYVYNIIIIYKHTNAVVDFSDFGVSYGIAFVTAVVVIPFVRGETQE